MTGVRSFIEKVGLGRLTGDAGAVLLGQISSFAYPLVSIPFLSRLLGATGLGALLLAMSIVQIVVLVVDFGFGMSAMREVAVTRSRQRLVQVVSRTLLAKLVLAGAATALLLPVVALSPTLRPHWQLYAIGAALLLGAVAYPMWLLQGLGKMKTFAALTAVSRLMCLVGLLLTVKTADDINLAMVWQFAPASLSAVLCWIYLRRAGLGNLRRQSPRAVWRTIKGSAPLFVSSMATMIIASINTVALGALSTAHQVAYYGTAERFSNAARGILGGVQQSMLPRMTAAAEAGEQMLRRTIMIGVAGVFLLAGAGLFAVSKVLVPWYLGAGFDAAITPVRLLSVGLAVTGVSSAFSLALVSVHRYRTFSTVMAVCAAVHVIILIPACLIGGAAGAALTVAITESLTASLLATTYWMARRKPSATRARSPLSQEVS